MGSMDNMLQEIRVRSVDSLESPEYPTESRELVVSNFFASSFAHSFH